MRRDCTTTRADSEARTAPTGEAGGGGFAVSGGGGLGGGDAPTPLPIGAYLHAARGTEGWVLDLYYRGARSHRRQGLVVGGGKRGTVEGLSGSAGRRMLWAAQNHPEPWRQWGRLGYPCEYPHDGRTCKRHLRALRERLRRRYPGLTWLWVFEFQRRGAPHFHFLFDEEVDGDWLAQAWYEIVGSGDPWHLRFGTWLEEIKSERAVCGYLGKYLVKMEQKELPPGFKWPGRFWGCSRGTAPLVQSYWADEKAGADITRAMRRFETGPRRGRSTAPNTVAPEPPGVRGDSGSAASAERRAKREKRFSGRRSWSSWRGAWCVGRLAFASCVRLL